MNGLFLLLLIVLAVSGAVTLWFDYRAFSREYDFKRVMRERREYQRSRRMHASYQGLRVVGGDRFDY